MTARPSFAAPTRRRLLALLAASGAAAPAWGASAQQQPPPCIAEQRMGPWILTTNGRIWGLEAPAGLDLGAGLRAASGAPGAARIAFRGGPEGVNGLIARFPDIAGAPGLSMEGMRAEIRVDGLEAPTGPGSAPARFRPPFWDYAFDGALAQNLLGGGARRIEARLTRSIGGRLEILASAVAELEGIGLALVQVRELAAGERQRMEAGQCRGCFLTTACVRAVGLADDCWELRQLRRFRDDWLARRPEGPAEIALYYREAPAVAADLSRAEALKLYRRVILPCALLIRAGFMEAAHRRYRAMMRGFGVAITDPC
ncbi:CFI-box-CTERM domain-containing protein [Neomegalonema perideroedes]|uniref:CFI-box-CTERM domain-containing protein n=1 Tax=Neomegalonema perideroedes TaxID=217219 RepID=UPI0012FDFC52|nr:CFI-box-CTERM domain-containing protein [Neomegalonema perideroedes]